MYYKAESYIGSEYAGKYLYDQGLTPIYVSDNPVLNAQHVLFEAAKGYHWGLPYHAALASVTTAPADDLGMGNRLGKIKPGFDADIVVWDSDPLSVGATPVQVWIDGAAQFDDAVELEKSHTGPMQPNEELGNIVDEPTAFQDALFSGVTKVLLDDEVQEASAGKPFNVAVTDGKVTCIGECQTELAAASKQNTKVIALKNGHIHKALTGVAGTLGLNEVDAEQSTGNGNSEDFTRAIDGLRLEGKKLHSAAKHGVTRAISAPNQSGKGSPFGVSVGFVTTAKTSLEDGAVFASDAAVHYTLDDHTVHTGSLSGAFGSLRAKLLKAIKAKKEESPEPYTEAAYLEDVVQGKKTLALTIESADGIATALRVKKEVQAANDGNKIHMAIMGGSESHLVADELAAASVGVILTPLLAVGRSWDTRRTLTGAPLTNGTVVDVLVKAGVTVGVGLQEDWTAMHLGLDAGWAWRNGNGKISEKAALDLVSDNVYKILGLEVPGGHADGHFVVSEGSPLEIGSRIKAVGSGRGQVDLFI